MAYAAIIFHPETDSAVSPAFIRDTEAEARAAALDSYVTDSEDWAGSYEEAAEAVEGEIKDGTLVVVVAAIQWE